MIRNVFIIFIVSGFWHGANWTFIVWGALNAFYFLPLMLSDKNRDHLSVVAKGKVFPTFKEVSQIAVTFGLTVLAWIFFRAENIAHAIEYLSGMFSSSLFSAPDIEGKREALLRIALIIIFMMVEWFGREQKYAIENMDKILRRSLRWVCYILIIVSIYIFGNNSESIEFIYFQF